MEPPGFDGIAAHYSTGALLDEIRSALAGTGTTTDEVTIEDLAPVDEFHIGGRAATRHLCGQLDISGDDHVLDIGCGIGGTARFLAATHGCTVAGIDLTPEYIAVAEELSRWTGLDDDTEFRVGSVLDTGVADDTFDVAVMVHVGMNIADKRALFTEIRRILRPGGRLGVYDIMRTSEAAIDYPVPWASDASISHLSDAQAYRRALTAAGLDVTVERDRGHFAREFFDKLTRGGVGGPPRLGLHLIMGTDAPTKVANMIAAVNAGTLAPTEIIAHKPV